MTPEQNVSVVIDVNGPAHASPSAEKIKRRRVTTACTSCRERRIKCDRIRPCCSQCSTGARSCRYVDKDASVIKFVNDCLAPSSDAERKPALSGSWKSAIDKQEQNFKQSNFATDKVPLWAAADAQEPLASSSQQALIAYAIPLSSLGENFNPMISSKLPSREICESFLEKYISIIHPLCPVCHIPTLRREYLEFWEKISPESSAKSLALFVAVLYTGASNSDSVDKTQVANILEIYDEILQKIPFPSYHISNTAASIRFLQAYTIMNTYKSCQLAPFFAYSFLPQAIRFAQSLRLHVEKKNSSTGDMEQEVMRRIWWHLVFLDMESTIATGLPPIIHGKGYTTMLPSVNDENLPSRLENSITDFRIVSPMMVAMQGHYKWASKLQAWFEILPSQDKVASYKKEIEALISLISDDISPDSTWARLYLKMQVDRAYCMLGLRFWLPDQYKGTGCNSEVVNTARSFIANYIALSTLPTHAHLRWFIPGLIQPLHAIVILLMHLSTCSDLPSEELSSRRLIDDTLRLRVNHILKGNRMTRSGGIDHPQRANPRYLIMVNLRKSVWKKIGWEDDGKSEDPWAGKKREGPCGVASGEEGERGATDVSRRENGSTERDTALPDVESWNTWFAGNNDTGLENLDAMLTGDPLDMFQWDEWDSLTSDFFAGT